MLINNKFNTGYWIFLYKDMNQCNRCRPRFLYISYVKLTSYLQKLFFLTFSILGLVQYLKISLKKHKKVQENQGWWGGSFLFCVLISQNIVVKSFENIVMECVKNVHGHVRNPLTPPPCLPNQVLRKNRKNKLFMGVGRGWRGRVGERKKILPFQSILRLLNVKQNK